MWDSDLGSGQMCSMLISRMHESRHIANHGMSDAYCSDVFRPVGYICCLFGAHCLRSEPPGKSENSQDTCADHETLEHTPSRLLPLEPEFLLLPGLINGGNLLIRQIKIADAKVSLEALLGP